MPLPAQAYERYRGKWIALEADGTSILASAESLSLLEEQLLAARDHLSYQRLLHALSVRNGSTMTVGGRSSQ